MKYIRTKDDVYDTETTVIVYADGVPCVEFWTGRFNSTYKKIIKQADTIEELCDGIIMTYTEFRTEYYVYEKLDDIPLLDLKCKNKYFNIYGFIGTDKGLIYVAKLNENGVLCLI